MSSNSNPNNNTNTNSTPVELPLLDKVDRISSFLFPCPHPSRPILNTPPPLQVYKRQKRHYYQHVPLFTTPSALTRHEHIRDTIQPGSLVQFYGNSEVLKYIQLAKWDPVVFLRHKFVCHTLTTEFYCNLNVGFGLNGAYFITTVLNGTPVLIDHILISRALSLHPKVAEQVPVDITNQFRFDKDEYQLYLSTFCGSDIPDGMFECDELVSVEYFLPKYQVLALVIRENVLPKPNHAKVFDFVDLKLMFCLVNDRVDFNLSYVILLNMIHAVQLNFMPYGMLLNSIFNFLKIDVNLFPSRRVSALICEKHNWKQTPLANFVSVINPALKLPKYIADHTKLVVKVDNMDKYMGTELAEIKGMHMRAVYRVNHLMKVQDNAMARIQNLEQANENLYRMIKEMAGVDDDGVPWAGPSDRRAFTGLVVDLEPEEHVETGSCQGVEAPHCDELA